MKDSRPLVSVILPTYNCAGFLSDSIGSIVSQSYKHFEIIVIDDGSTDETGSVLAPFQPVIRHIRFEDNRGLPRARNTGIRMSRGEYIAFLDADDIWLPEKLQAAVEYFSACSDVGMVYTNHVNIDKEGNVLVTLKRPLPSGDIFLRLFAEQNFIVASSVVVRRDVFEKTGLFDEQFINCQDWDMWLRIAFHFKVAGINKPLVKYRHNPASLSKNRDSVLRYQRNVIEKIYNEFKGTEKGLTERLYKKRLASHYAKVGRHYLRTGNKYLAHENFCVSLQYDPFSLRTIRYYLTTYPFPGFRR